jgi:AcrR family transcriptional regulator
MGRNAKFSREDILAAGLDLAAARGPSAVTMAAVAHAVGAPMGSIYHRFESREVLLAELWLDAVERFQASFVAKLDRAETAKAAEAIGVEMLQWTRAHLREARLLAVHRRQDFVSGGWPSALARRAVALEPQLSRALRAFARRVLGSADRAAMARVRFALIDAPLGAVRPYLAAGRPPPKVLDRLISKTIRAALTD